MYGERTVPGPIVIQAHSPALALAHAKAMYTFLSPLASAKEVSVYTNHERDDVCNGEGVDIKDAYLITGDSDDGKL